MINFTNSGKRFQSRYCNFLYYKVKEVTDESKKDDYKKIFR